MKGYRVEVKKHLKIFFCLQKIALICINVVNMIGIDILL